MGVKWIHVIMTKLQVSRFAKGAIEDLGNPFEEESTDLLVLDTKEITDHASVEAVQNVRRIGQEQFEAFTRECLVERSKSIDDVIHRNKLKLFGSATKKNASKAVNFPEV